MGSSREVDGEDSSLGMRRTIQKMDLKSSRKSLLAQLLLSVCLDHFFLNVGKDRRVRLVLHRKFTCRRDDQSIS
jgi:hypothetical protein